MRTHFITLALLFELLLASTGSRAASTLLEFSSGEQGAITGTVSDMAGNMYVCGQTTQPSKLPGKTVRLGPGGGTDLFIIKFDPQGQRLSTVVLGGSGEEYGARIAVNSQGQVVIAGQSSSTNFPTGNSFASAGSPAPELFVCKLDAALANQLFGTYLGTAGEWVGVALDPDDNIYLAGNSSTPNFFTDIEESSLGAFVAKLPADGSALSFVARVGSPDALLYGFAVDGEGNTCVVGTTSRTDLPMVNALQPVKPGLEQTGNGFLVRLDKKWRGAQLHVSRRILRGISYRRGVQRRRGNLRGRKHLVRQHRRFPAFEQ